MTPEWTKPAAVIALLLLGSGLLCISVRAPDKEELEARPLRAGASVKRTLDGGEHHLYRVSIEPGDAFLVVFNPERNDLVFTLVDPLRSNRLQVDSQNGYHGTELLSVVADIRGYHLLEVRAPPGTAASYELTVGKPRPATRDDRLRAAATSAFSRGELLFDVAGGKSAAWYRRALSLWEQVGELERATATRFRLGRVLQNQDEWEEAQEVYQTALVQARSRGDGLAEASLLDRIGRSHYEQGNFDDAERAYERSRRLFREAGYGPGEADALSDLGLVYRRRGDFEKGLKLGLEALDLYRKLKRPGDQVLLLWNIGELYLGLGELRSALDAFEQAGEIGQALDRPDLLAPSLAGQGTALAELGDLNRASSLLERAVELSQQFDRRWEVSGRVRLGDVYARAGRFQDARDQYEGALKVARDSGYRRGEAMALGNLGHVLDRMHMEQTAIGYFDEARSILQELEDLDGVAKVLKGRAEAALGLGDVETARSSAEAGIRIVEDLRSPLPNAFSDRRELYDLYVEILMRLHEKEPARQLDKLAFNVVERWRSRSFLDELKETQVDSREKSDLKRRLIALEDKRSSLSAGSARSKIDRESRELEARLNLMSSERKGGDEYARALTLEEIQSQLGEDTVMLSYFLGGRRNLLWEVTRDRFVTHELGLPSDLEERVTRLRDLLAHARSRKQQTWSSLLEKLSQDLLGPVAGHLEERQILVSPDGALYLFPFAAMLDPGKLEVARDSPPPFLILDHQIMVVPSFSSVALSRKLRAGRPPAPRLIALLTDPVFDQKKFKRLSYTQQEAEAILRAAPPGRSFLASRFLANRSTAMSPELGLYNYLHFATHAELGDRPDLSKIVLSLVDEQGRPQDGFLRAFEIYDLHLASDLVVLSACETALGSEKGGLVRAFLHAGSKQVLATLWKVPDRSTAQLMELFYRALLRQGLPPAAALRQAQVEMLGTDWESPHYWAGFVLQGEWQ